MLDRLLQRTKKKPTQRRRRPTGWRQIGWKSYDEERFENVPQWVRKEIDRIYCDGPGTSLGEMTYHLKGKKYRYMLDFGGQGGSDLTVHRKRRYERIRATVVATRDDRVLLVQEKGKEMYSLPGGGPKRGEPSIAAAARELYEEPGLNCSKIELQFSYGGGGARHEVFHATPTGHPKLKSNELSRFFWWDGQRDVKVEAHVLDILGRMGWPGFI